MAHYTLEIYHDGGEGQISKGETFSIVASHAAEAKTKARDLLAERGTPRLRALTFSTNNRLLAYILDPEAYPELPVNAHAKLYHPIKD